MVGKIRTLISYNDIEIANKIEESIKDLDFVDVVAKTTTGQETYDSIISYKPDMVFMKYENSDMNTIDMISNVIKELPDKTPLFNLFADNSTMQELSVNFKRIGKALNAYWNDVDVEWIKEVLQDYSEYKYNN